VLAYEVVLEGFQADTTPSVLHVLVDAATGAPLDSWDEIHTLLTTGRSLYSGTVPITVLDTGAFGYALWDSTRGNGFKQYDAKNQTSGVFLYFQNHDNVWGNGTTSDRETAAVDVHYGTALTYDYFKNVHGRNGLDGAGYMGYGEIHYGSNYNNAFWDARCDCVHYGDGDGVRNRPLVSLDTVGHELTHSVTYHTIGWRYSGEPGGINESTSDIFGTLVEFYAGSLNDPGDFVIGEKSYTPGIAGDALRYMYKPSKDGYSVDCWSTAVASMDPHYSSGVGNHFFYLLAQGSNSFPASPTCNGRTVTGVGLSTAGKIWYRAYSAYMTSQSTYAHARLATLQAATDLFGQGSAQYNAVAAAWSAVNVN
jgi:Zn-dependent metalloprotease